MIKYRKIIFQINFTLLPITYKLQIIITKFLLQVFVSNISLAYILGPMSNTAGWDNSQSRMRSLLILKDFQQKGVTGQRSEKLVQIMFF